MTTATAQPRGPLLGEQGDQLAPGGRVLAERRLVEHERPAGEVASAVATDSRRCWPPESVYGFASAKAVRPSRSSSSSAVARAAAACSPGAQRPEGQLVAQPAGEELLLGVLEDRADPA